MKKNKVFYFDNKNWMGVSVHRYDKLKEEYDAILVLAKLLGWKWDIERSYDTFSGVEILFYKNEIKQKIILAFQTNFVSNELYRIIVKTKNNMNSNKDCMKMLEEFRRYL